MVAALPGYNLKYRKAERALKKLCGGQKENQMICGPGGSGKSTVINVVQVHAESYCETIGHPHVHRTIVVTAMSGMAVTLLQGETAHKALGLMKTSSHFTQDELDE
jgi:ABC-type molybdenum transport system ATPase subunit/photorepair protein PhrA